MPAPRFLGNSTLLGEPKPINWKGVGQALWDANLNPLRGPYELMNTPADTLLYDTGPAAEKAAGDTFFTAMGLTGGSALAPKPSNALTMGIKAYHGSPHSFDKFEWSPKTRGTGEGAQAYGDGLYFAENEGIAKGYRDQLSNRDGSGYATAHLNAQNLVNKVGGDTEFAAQVLRDQLDQVGEEGTAQKLRDTLDFITSGRYAEPLPPAGHVYEVNIDADPNAFLDWDKPLSEQPPAVADALRKIGFEDAKWPYTGLMGPNSMLTKNSPGQEIYNAVGKERGSNSVGKPRDINKAGASEALKEAGIPGIKYLDAGSRGAGDGTRNYVVFDDKLISIVKKYGIAGASAMVGYNVLQGLDKAQAATLNKADLDHKYDQFLRSGGI